MEKRTIAEYVESEQVAEKLREIGIDFYQGYLVSEPIPLENLA
jgi:EAL domain-containing protein (putative c-di-GMP-specific phosphodiesterase class I)